MQFDEIKGADADRCVFRSKETNPRFFKVYFDERFNRKVYKAYDAFHREYFVTKLLARGMENVVKQDEGELDTSQILKDAFSQNTVCAGKINDPANKHFPHFITHHIGPKTKTLSAWLETQDEIPDAVIKSFAFQLIYLVGKMHSQFGVQHNDIYEPNIMVEPIEASNKIVLDIVIGNDLFKLPLTTGHLRVFLFDFGASRLQKPPGTADMNNVWENTSNVSFVTNNPPEVLYTSGDYTQKGPESDMFMIGHVLLTMIANGRGGFKYREYVGVHTFDVSASSIYAQGMDGKTAGILTPSAVVLEKLGFSTTDADEVRQVTEMIWLNLIALDVMFRGYEKAKTPPSDLKYTQSSGVAKFYADMDSLRSSILTGKKAFRKDYATNHFAWLKSACETHHPYAFSLLRRLMAFSPTERRGFALPGSSYCLTGALFHPYFQSFYKGTENGVGNLLFNPPLLYNTTSTAVTITSTTNLQQQEDIFYGDLLFKFLRDFSATPIAIALQTFIKNQANDAVLDGPTVADIDVLLSKVYPIIQWKNKPERKVALKQLVGLFSKLSGTQQSLLQTKSAEASAAQAAKAKAEAEAQRLAEEARLAQEELDRKAQAKSKADADATEAKRVKDEAEAKALEDAKAAAAAKAAKDVVAQAEAEKKALEALEQARLAEEEKKRKDAEAATKAAAEAAAKAEAEKKQREAEEAARASAAAKAAQEEATRKAEEAARVAAAEEEARRKAEEAARAKPAPIPPSGGASSLSKQDLDSLARLQTIMNGPGATSLKTLYGLGARAKAQEVAVRVAADLSNAAKTALEYAAKFNAPDEFKEKLPNVDVVYLAEPVKLLDGSGAINGKTVQGAAGEIIVMYLLVYKKSMTAGAIDAFYDKTDPKTGGFAAYTAWFNAKLGTFYSDIGLASRGGSAAVAPSEEEEETKSAEPAPAPTKSTDRPSPVPVPIPQGGKEALKKATSTNDLKRQMEQLMATNATNYKIADPANWENYAPVLDSIRELAFGDEAGNEVVNVLKDVLANVYSVIHGDQVHELQQDDFGTTKWETKRVLAVYNLLGKIFVKTQGDIDADLADEVTLIMRLAGMYDASTKTRKGHVTTSAEFTKAMSVAMQELAGVNSNIQGDLENIEHLQEYKKSDGSLDHDYINETLFIPLKEMIAEQSHLGVVASHLGMNKTHFLEGAAVSGVDMSNTRNQIRYLHTLSIAAGLCDNYKLEEQERCFVEWPPKIPYKAGQVNEI